MASAAAAPAEGSGTAPDTPLTFSDLPDEVLALTAGLGLTDARDVASFAAVSTRCAAVCKAAPLRLTVPVRPGAASSAEEQAAARATLRSLCQSWPGTAQLDLRGCPVEDDDMLRALGALPTLRLLQASGCKKLSPALPAALAAAPPHPHLRVLTLQRCYQLTGAALTDVFAAAARPGSRLAAAALSHLSLEAWPGPGAPPPRTALRVLALHNCGGLGDGTLRGLAAACPQLEVLMLGGATWALGGAPPGSAGSAAGPAGEPAERLHQAALAAVAAGPYGPDGGLGAYVAGVAAALAGAAAALPRLRALELTCSLPGLVPALQRMAATEPLLLAGRKQPLQMWDLCTAAGVAAALRWRADSALHGGDALGSAGADALLSAAANCSSPARQTALHAAAEEGSPALLRALLRLGAAVDARDRGGATPLFAACEAGRLASVECLLGAGAAATLKNSTGEAPLYIAALKGHERVVDALLAHCRERGVPWQAHCDGDAWTPLMAAAVGGRTGIVRRLLQAAGREAPELVQAANRYGQTCVHIAARKGSASLLRALVDAGGAASVAHADADGRTAAEIARSMRNGGAAKVLGDAAGVARREAQRQRGTVPTAERPRASQPQQRWVGRRLQQRKATGVQGSAGGH